MKIAILCPAEIANRRFLPSLAHIEEASFAGISYHTKKEEAARLAKDFGGMLFDDPDALVTSPEVDAVYIPAVPAQHYTWAMKALAAGKHVMMEKPFTVTYEQAALLADTARTKGLALHENFTFLYHKQLREIEEILKEGRIGDIRFYRLAFCFPGRPAGDFRYRKEDGGGAFLDAGCYTIRLGLRLLGESAPSCRTVDGSCLQ